MSEAEVIDPNALPLTVESMSAQLAACGMAAGQTVLVHTRMSALGWIAGGAAALIQALLSVLTPTGTLMMPSFSPDLTDPANWNNPPVPEHWWPIIRQHMPAYDPATTPTWGLGRVPELFRRWPGVIRSNNPDASFAAIGPNAVHLTENHTDVAVLFGESSPVARLYRLDGYVCMLGLDHSRNTSLHLAEFRADVRKPLVDEGIAMRVDGVRQWVAYRRMDWDDSDFSALGADYEAAHGIPVGRVGKGEVHFMKQRPLIDYGVGWLEQHRGRVPREGE